MESGRDPAMNRRACFIFFLTVVSAACRQRAGEVVEIPHGYRGWVEITYSPKCPPAPELSGGRRLLRINGQGRLCVGSPWQEGDAVDELYYVAASGKRTVLHEETPRTGMIWGRSTRQSNLSAERTDRFFVGSESQFRSLR